MAQEGEKMAHGGEKEGHAQAQTLFLLRFPNVIINVKIRLIYVSLLDSCLGERLKLATEQENDNL